MDTCERCGEEAEVLNKDLECDGCQERRWEGEAQRYEVWIEAQVDAELERGES